MKGTVSPVRTTVAVLIALSLARVAPAQTVTIERPSLAEATRADTEWLAADYDNRLVGSEAHDRASADLLKKVNDIPGVRVWTQSFPVVAPRVTEARLTITDASAARREMRVYPLWPAVVRLNTTPTEGLTGRLVYIGDGNVDEVPAASLRGQIAVMEMTGGRGWQRAMNAGAQAIILLGSPGETQLDAHAHIFTVPVNAPRCYVPEGPDADVLRSGFGASGHLLMRGEWVDTTAVNIYALATPGETPPGRKAIAVAAAYDAMSVVPELATGADAAVDAALALNLLRAYSRGDFAAIPTPVEEGATASIGEGAATTPRPLLVAFVDAYGINQLGMRELFVSLSVPTEERERKLYEERDTHKDYLEHEALAAEVEKADDPLEALLKRNKRDLHRYIKDEVAHEVVAIEQVMHPLRLRLYNKKLDDATREALSAEEAEMKIRRSSFFEAQKYLLDEDAREEKKDEDVDDTARRRALAEDLWRRARARIAKQLEEVTTFIDHDMARDELRREVRDALGLPEDEPQPIDFLLALDVSDAGVASGLILSSHLWRWNETGNTAIFRRWLGEVDRNESEAVWPGELRKAVNLEPLKGLDSPDSHIVGFHASMTETAQSFGMAAATWTTLDALRLRVDTGRDRADLLDWSRLNPQIDATFALVARLTNDPTFKSSNVVPKWVRVRGSVVDQSPGEPIPRLPMGDYLTVLMTGITAGGKSTIRDYGRPSGVRRLQVERTRTDGKFLFDALPCKVYIYSGQLFMQSYLVNEEGAIARAIDMRKVGKGVVLKVDLRAAKQDALRGVAFTCEEINAFELFDPRFLASLPSGSVIDVRRGGTPQRLNYMLAGGVFSCLLEPRTKWELILRAGLTRNRMALINMATLEEGEEKGLSVRESMRGFDIDEPLPAHPFYVAARDLYNLDQRRLSDYRKAGISSRAIEGLTSASHALLIEADDAITRDDGADLYRAASGALANEVRAYHAVREMANDVIRGAIFLLLALAPFAYAFERLVFASPHVYRQITYTLAIFGVMTLLLWSFHPAFAISGQPLMIIMAFGVILMSLLVISMVYSRFDTALEEMRSGRAEAAGARTSRWGVATTAFRLGIANMRRRKLRTALTGITVILVTFALLCFTSTSNFVGQKEFSLDIESPYSGVLIRQPSTRTMPDEALNYIESIISARADGEKRFVAPRFWWANQWNAQWRAHIRNPANGVQISLKAAVGLSPEEAKLTGVDEVCPDWERFVALSENADSTGGGCYLADEIAEQIGVAVGETVTLAGRELELVGVYKAIDLTDRARGIDGQPILPADYSSMGDDERRQMADVNLAVLASEMEGGGGLEPDSDLPRLSGSDIIIVPAQFLRGLRDATLRSIAISAESPEDARALAYDLVQRLAFPIYYSSPDGSRVVATTPLLPKLPKSVLIPLLIAGLIIFNTMLSSIAERKREIHIYTSLGLAPLHVGFLFLAEAVTYGLMGSIFGYVVGQGVARVFTELGLMGGLTLNYSGTQAIMVMMLVMGVVIVSSLIPAYLAGKLAAPSNDMTWHVPRPEDDVIRDTLPFTVTDKTANGVIAYLLEYFEAHRDGNIGAFSTDDLKTFREQHEDHALLGIEGTVWLAPYDLGVRQTIRLSVRDTGEADIFALDLELHRGSGQVRSWWNLNRVFIGDLRKQLLGWRKLNTESALRYISEATEMLGRG